MCLRPRAFRGAPAATTLSRRRTSRRCAIAVLRWSTSSCSSPAVPRIYGKIHGAVTGKVAAGRPWERAMLEWALQCGAKARVALRAGQQPDLFMDLQYPIANCLVLSNVQRLFGPELVNVERALRESRYITEAVVYGGDNRPYLVAMLTLDRDELMKLAHRLRIATDPVTIATAPAGRGRPRGQGLAGGPHARRAHRKRAMTSAASRLPVGGSPCGDSCTPERNSDAGRTRRVMQTAPHRQDDAAMGLAAGTAPALAFALTNLAFWLPVAVNDV